MLIHCMFHSQIRLYFEREFCAEYHMFSATTSALKIGNPSNCVINKNGSSYRKFHSRITDWNG